MARVNMDEAQLRKLLDDTAKAAASAAISALQGAGNSTLIPPGVNAAAATNKRKPGRPRKTEATSDAGPITYETKQGRVREGFTEIYFSGKPADSVLAVLRQHGLLFKRRGFADGSLIPGRWYGPAAYVAAALKALPAVIPAA